MTRPFVAALYFSVLAAAALAAPPPVLHGRVTDARSGQPLPGARVRLMGSDRHVLADRSGEYRLALAGSGDLQVEITFLGFDASVATVTAPAEGELRHDAALKRSGFGEALEVNAPILEGQAKALNQQMNAPNITNVVAADQIGLFPDPNAAEAVQRVPGVSIQRDQGEGRYVLVRGTESRLNSMMIDGERIPSPEGDVRSVALDVIPADLLESIEVTKALTPDMDGDSIGGAVNLVTKSAASAPSGSVVLGGGYNAVSGGAIQTGRFNLNRRVGDRLGLALAGSFMNTERGSENFEAEYDDGALDSLELRDYTINRRRLGLNGGLEYKLADGGALYVRGLFGTFRDHEYRQRFVNAVGDEALERELKDRLETQGIFSIAAGGRHGLGRVRLDYQVSFARSKENEPEAYYTTFVQEDVSFSPTVPSGRARLGDVRANPSGEDIAAYEFDGFSSEPYLTTDRDVVGALNLTLPFSSRRAAGFVKLGGKVRDKDKERDASIIGFEPEDAPPLADFLDRGFDAGNFLGGMYAFGPGLDPAPGRRIPGLSGVESETDPEEDAADYSAGERISAGYAMAQVQLGSSLTLLPGVRVERTEVDYTGYEVLFDDEGDHVSTLPRAGRTSYTTALPMVHVKLTPAPRTALRAAVTRSLARPNYRDLTPFQLVLDEDLEIERGNPSLRPTTSWNFDVMFERYLSSVGVVSAGVFHKRLTDYIYDFSFEEARRGGDYDVTEPRNGDAATLVGAELAFQSQLRFLPAPFDGFGLYANYTFTDSEAEFPGREGEKATLPGQARHVGNLALSYEKHGFSGRVGVNFHGKYIDAVGGSVAEDVYYDDHVQLDVSASQRLGKRLRVFVELNNLTDAPLRYYEGSTDRPIQEEYYRFWGTLGLKWTF
jgi:TonB-dependent receptor